MINATLTDVPAGKVHDLGALIKKHGEVKIGRMGARKGAHIEIGVLEIPEGTVDTRLEAIDDARALRNTSLISGEHAILTYEKGEMGEGFYLKDISRNGTAIDRKLYHGEKLILHGGDEIHLPRYGPVKFETD